MLLSYCCVRGLERLERARDEVCGRGADAVMLLVLQMKLVCVLRVDKVWSSGIVL